MLVPKKTKHRKWHKGRSRTRVVETRGLSISYGVYGLQATESARLNSRQIEAARRTITGSLKREGKLFIRVFPHKPVTKRPPEMTLGGGKGSVDHYVAEIKPGRIVFELDGTSKEKALRAFKLAAYKLPFKSKVVIKENA
jgi:large subunit ribosomal protein L16